MLDVSDTTGEEYYSGTANSLTDFLLTLNIGEGKADRITFETINRYQEMIDREIDAILNEVYYTPIRAYNQVRPIPDKNGKPVTKRVFPGDVRRLAKMWTAGQILVSEFQQLEPNLTDQATNLINEAKTEMYSLAKPTHWIEGQRRKSNISRTINGHFQPAALPELNV